jgi:N6-adenosine-specific RNA methylase IME4
VTDLSTRELAALIAAGKEAWADADAIRVAQAYIDLLDQPIVRALMTPDDFVDIDPDGDDMFQRGRPPKRPGGRMKYRTIVADPPWDHADGTGVKLDIGYGAKRRPLPPGEKPHVTTLPYDVMSLSDIRALPVADLAASDAHLYLWTTNRYLRHVWDIAEGWGFRGVCVLTWCKEPRGFLGGGAFPSNTEFCLFARRGELATVGRAVGRWFRWPRRFGPPVREGEKRKTMHSAKPEAFLDVVESVSPSPYLELFARRQRLGWDTWGNEALEHVDLKTGT